MVNVHTTKNYERLVKSLTKEKIRYKIITDRPVSIETNTTAAFWLGGQWT
jgi:hypothetical protein